MNPTYFEGWKDLIKFINKCDEKRRSRLLMQHELEPPSVKRLFGAQLANIPLLVCLSCPLVSYAFLFIGWACPFSLFGNPWTVTNGKKYPYE